MEFFLRLGVDQVNLVLKSLETMRDQSGNLHQDLVQQIQAQSQARNTSAASNQPAVPDDKPQEQATT